MPPKKEKNGRAGNFWVGGWTEIVDAERDIAGVLRECYVQERTKQLQNVDFEVPTPLQIPPHSFPNPFQSPTLNFPRNHTVTQEVPRRPKGAKRRPRGVQERSTDTQKETFPNPFQSPTLNLPRNHNIAQDVPKIPKGAKRRLRDNQERSRVAKEAPQKRPRGLPNPCPKASKCSQIPRQTLPNPAKTLPKSSQNRSRRLLGAYLGSML